MRQNKHSLETIVSNVPIILWSLDQAGTFTVCEGKGLEVLGVRPGQTVGRSIDEVCSGVPQIVADSRRALSGESTRSVIEYGDLAFECWCIPVRNPLGQVTGMMGVATDITGRLRVDRELASLRHHHDLILNSAGEGIYGLDRYGNITFANPAAAQMLGHLANEMIGKTVWDLIRPARSDGTPYHWETCPIFDTLKEGIDHHMSDDLYIRKDGSAFPVECVATPIRESDRIVGAVVVFKDLSSQKMQNAILEHHALYDDLTDLPNRTLLHSDLEQAISTGCHEREPFALLLMDLDRFKEVNDILGHQNGDYLLQQVGPSLRRVLGHDQKIARLGGDEFAVLLPGADMEEAIAVAQKILNALDQPFVVGGLSLGVGVSLGIVLFPEHGKDADTILRRAEVAMYVAKQTGSGYTIYTPGQDEYDRNRLTLLSELRHAIDHQEMILYYQPKLCLETGQVKGVEALVRWQHPRRGLVLPDQFVPFAEQTGLIRPLTLWVFRAALEQYKVWQQGGHMISLALNLSARILQDPQLLDQIKGMLDETGISPELLELEITEGSIMLEPGRSIEVLNRLSQIGAKISIDDFGIGYSSLAYLKKLPVSSIKIDKSFVIGMGSDEEDAVIVRSMIDLAHRLGLRIVAEGVESQEVLDRLVTLRCDEAQGFYIARPMPGPDFEPCTARHTGRFNGVPTRLASG